jgi:hypothetical protein
MVALRVEANWSKFDTIQASTKKRRTHSKRDGYSLTLHCLEDHGAGFGHHFAEDFV